MATELEVEVAYAGVTRQVILAISVPVGTTILKAIEYSEIRLQFPEIETLVGRVGIFGRLVPLDLQIKSGDRVEIYRQLLNDPKEARRQRADLEAKKARQARDAYRSASSKRSI